MVREYHKWFSQHLDRDMEMLVFGHGGARVLVFPTRKGRFFEYENIGCIRCLEDKIEAGALQLFCVDSADADTLYADHHHPQTRIDRHKLYESYILEEVLPFTEDNNSHPRLVAHGCSFGAFHSVNIAFRHPDVFKEVVAFSGRYDLTMQVAHFSDLFSGYYNEDIYFHTPSHFIPNMSDEQILDKLRSMRIVLTIGAEDPFYHNNASLSHSLSEKQIPHELYIWDGECHRASSWRSMVRHYLA